MVPLLKGLKLGPVKISLAENSQYCGSFGAVCTQERTVCKIRLRDPLDHMNDDQERVLTDENDDFAYQDRWEVNTMLQIPPSLSKCTQDCTLLNSIKVRHKIKFIISLVNPDGHVSELRASLPVQLFISPFVPLGVKSTDGLYSSANNSSIDIANDARLHSQENESDDETIFGRNASELDLPLNNQNNVSIAASMSDMMSPPNYGRHIYDRLWSDLSDANTPPLSGAQTPQDESQNGNGNRSASVLDNQENIDQLQQNLQRLHVERENDEGETASQFSPPPSLARNGNLDVIAPHPSSSTRLEQVGADCAIPQARPGLRGLNSPSMTPLFAHISRENSFLQPPGSSPTKKDWEIGTMSRVPSYDKAMKSDMIGDDLPPIYPAPSKENNQEVLERPQIVHHKSSSSFFATPNGTHMSQAALSRSNNSSSSSLSTSHTNSSTSLSNNSTAANKGQTANRYFSFGMTPVDNNESSTSLHLQRSSSKGKLSKSSGSFSNLMGLLTKKEKK